MPEQHEDPKQQLGDTTSLNLHDANPISKGFAAHLVIQAVEAERARIASIIEGMPALVESGGVRIAPRIVKADLLDAIRIPQHGLKNRVMPAWIRCERCLSSKLEQHPVRRTRCYCHDCGHEWRFDFTQPEPGPESREGRLSHRVQIGEPNSLHLLNPVCSCGLHLGTFVTRDDAEAAAARHERPPKKRVDVDLSKVDAKLKDLDMMIGIRDRRDADELLAYLDRALIAARALGRVTGEPLDQFLTRLHHEIETNRQEATR